MKKSLSVCLGEEDSWIANAIEKKRQELADVGIRISTKQMIIKALQKVFAPYKDSSYRPKSPPPKIDKVEVLTIRLSGKNAWLGEVLKKLANLKMSLGLVDKCTPEEEFIRLAINGYKNIKTGTELDRILLEKDDATTE